MFGWLRRKPKAPRFHVGQTVLEHWMGDVYDSYTVEAVFSTPLGYFYTVKGLCRVEVRPEASLVGTEKVEG